MSKVYYEYTHLCGNEEETFPSVVGQNRKRPVGDSSSTISSPSKGQRSQRRYKISVKTHRDVTAFQKKHQIGGGNYGSVFVGVDKVTRENVALKRMDMNDDREEYYPLLIAIDEVRILKKLRHENIIKLKEVVTSKDSSDNLKNIYLVFEYLEYDLASIIETKEIEFTLDHIKSWSRQLMKGVQYMHDNGIIHRDLKSSNILISRQGELKIADLGLARDWTPEMKRLTNLVITLWYRPPELLLGCVRYSPKIDMWSVGCIIAELFLCSALLRGDIESHQLYLIFKMMGHPNTNDTDDQGWPNINAMCPLWKNYKPEEEGFPRRLREELTSRLPPSAMNWMTPHAMDLIDHLLAYNPERRMSAVQGLTAQWFFDNPIVKSADELNMNFDVESAHEWEMMNNKFTKEARLVSSCPEAACHLSRQ